MKQNKYDDPGFFANYSQMARSIGGLDAAGEWPAFRALHPKLRDKNVLDLGCGFGWHCRYARERQARSVVGVDLSEKMIARARESTNDSAIEYRRLAIEDIDFSAGEFDVVFSSLALHYVDHYQDEGPRQARFLDHDVLKYHRTVVTHLNTLIDAGFTITKLSEPQPTQEMLDKHPEMRDETRRPMFLLIAAVKNEK